jgi:hypothetical protein
LINPGTTGDNHALYLGKTGRIEQIFDQGRIDMGRCVQTRCSKMKHALDVVGDEEICKLDLTEIAMNEMAGPQNRRGLSVDGEDPIKGVV